MKMINFDIIRQYGRLLYEYIRGVIKVDDKAEEIRLSSIDDKNTRPICFISYNHNKANHYASKQECVDTLQDH